MCPISFTTSSHLTRHLRGTHHRTPVNQNNRKFCRYPLTMDQLATWTGPSVKASATEQRQRQRNEHRSASRSSSTSGKSPRSRGSACGVPSSQTRREQDNGTPGSSRDRAGSGQTRKQSPSCNPLHRQRKQNHGEGKTSEPERRPRGERGRSGRNSQPQQDYEGGGKESTSASSQQSELEDSGTESESEEREQLGYGRDRINEWAGTVPVAEAVTNPPEIPPTPVTTMLLGTEGPAPSTQPAVLPVNICPPGWTIEDMGAVVAATIRNMAILEPSGVPFSLATRPYRPVFRPHRPSVHHQQYRPAI